MLLQSSLSLLPGRLRPFLLWSRRVLMQPLLAHLCKPFYYIIKPAVLLALSKEGAFNNFSPVYRESVRACALCNCVERSLHGQRELRHFGPFSERPTLKPSASPLPQPGNDDLSSIGFPDSPCLTALLDDSG